MAPGTLSTPRPPGVKVAEQLGQKQEGVAKRGASPATTPRPNRPGSGGAPARGRRRRPHDVAELQIRRRQTLDLGDPPRPVHVSAPEYIVLCKLDGYRRGDCASDRQWPDVLGVLKRQGVLLDRAYLTRTAGEVGLEDLLARAEREAGLSQSG